MTRSGRERTKASPALPPDVQEASADGAQSWKRGRTALQVLWEGKAVLASVPGPSLHLILFSFKIEKGLDIVTITTNKNNEISNTH